MKLEVERYRIKIIPESEIDEAYLEEVLGLKKKEDTIKAKRVNAINMSCWAYLEIKAKER